MGMIRKAKKDLRKIAIFGHKTIPSREGGIEVVVQEMSIRMAEQGLDITCMNRAGKHDMYENREEAERWATYRGIKLKTVPTIGKSGLAAVTSSFFATWKAAIGPYDLVHIHAEGPAAFCWIPKLFGKRIVVTIHGLDWQRDKWKGFAKKYIHYGEKMAVKYADEIIVLSNSMKKYFKESYNRDTNYIPNGTFVNRFVDPKLIHSEFGLNKDDYVLYLGRLVPEKKADILIEAFKRTQTYKKLVIAGPDLEKDAFCRKLHKLTKDDPRIIFTGFVRDRMFEELMSNAYLYVLPSKLEGMPLSLLEAMSFGNCCITSNIPECKEVIEDHGFTVEPENIEALKCLMQHLIDHPEVVENYRKDVSEFVESKYSWDDVVSKTMKLYQKSLGYDEEPDFAEKKAMDSKHLQT